MHPIQIAVILALVGGTIAYIGYRIRRDIRAQREFFRALVAQLTTVLARKGIRLSWSADLSKSIGGSIATYEGPTYFLEVFFDLVDREVALLQRGTGVPRSAWQRIAAASLPSYAKPDTFTTATAVIVDAGVRSDDTAYLTPARFEVRDAFEITDRARALSGIILAGRFRVGTRVWAEHTPSVTFTISDVGFLDDIARQRAFVTLLSEDAPPLTKLREMLAAGSILTDAVPVADAT